MGVLTMPDDPDAGDEPDGGGGAAAKPKPAANTDSQPAWQWAVVLTIAVALVGLYIVFAWRIYNSRDEEAEAWARGLVVFGGIEALAFAAAGWMFGREVNRKALANAEKEADKADGEAKQARAETAETAAELSTAKVRAVAMAYTVRSLTNGARFEAADQGGNELADDAARILREYGDLTGR